MNQLKKFFNKPFFLDNRTLLALWLILPIISTLTKLSKHNNFLIFRYVYWHTVEGVSLYEAYPEYFDYNYYGPVFSLIIAPFALFPDRKSVV